MTGVIRFVAGVVSILIGSVAAGFGLVHYGVASTFWLLIFGVITLVGLILLVWGSKTVLSAVSVEITVSDERDT